jgi:cytochrome c biogenesis protein
LSGDKSWLTKFRSMKTGLILVLAIILASIAGTILPQQGLHGLTGRWYSLLQLDDVFHSWWYVTLLALAALNLMACSFYRLKNLTQRREETKPLLESSQLDKLQEKQAFVLTGPCHVTGDRIINLLTSRGYETWYDRPEPGKWRIGAEQGRLHLWASLITHFSFLVIMLGVLTGAVFGFQSSINAPVGAVFGLDSIPGSGVAPGREDFKLRVDDFRIERYADSTPAGYYSQVTIIREGQAEKTATIAVNSPLEYNGVKFYQASYGEAIKVDIMGTDGMVIDSGLVLYGQRFAIPGTEYSVSASSQLSAPHPDGSTESFGRQVIYAVFQGNQPESMGRTSLATPIKIGNEDKTVSFVEIVPYTGLLVKKDPGVPLIWLGSFFLLVGMGISFFMRPHRLWLVLQQEGSEIAVLIGGISKNRFMLADSIKSLSHDIQRGASTGVWKVSDKEMLLNGNI